MVSVIIPTYNRAEVLPRAIESVLSQTYEDLELIVVDDASTDDTAAVIEQYDDRRIRYYCFEKNKGANAARNRGIKLANGKYISFLDSDDELKPTYIEQAISEFNKIDNRCVCVFTSFSNMNNKKLIDVSKAKDGYVTYNEILSDNVVGGFSCVTFKSIVFDTVGELDETLQSQQDYDYFIRIYKHNYQIFGVDKELVVCHKSSGNRISDNLSNKLNGSNEILSKHSDLLNKKGKSRLYYYSAIGYAQKGKMKNARNNFKKSIYLTPRRWSAYIHFIAAVNISAFNLLISIKKIIKRLINLIFL